MSTVPQRLGKYELRQRLGRGNVGEVWKAFDLQLRREVAIKIIHSDLQADPSFLARFMQEGQAIASLHHANITQVHEVNYSRPAEGSSTTAYIVSEYIEGETLTDYISRTSRKGDFPPVADIVYLFTSLGVAIDYAHQKGIVHGDIKPGNILLDKHNTSQFLAGEPTLTDFGLARLLGNATIIGTPLYMSPEQAKGYSANNRSDIYSLGVILYEMCTGVQPFRDNSSVAVLKQHIDTLPTPPSLINHNVPPALSEVILRAMAKDTATRFSMASLLAAAIADACSMQSSLSIAQERAAIDNEAAPTTGPHTSILGVSQPLSRIQVTQPRLPQISKPFPAVPAPTPASITNGNHTPVAPAAQVPVQNNNQPPTPPQPYRTPSAPLPMQQVAPLPPAPGPVTSGPLSPLAPTATAPVPVPYVPPVAPVRPTRRLRVNDVPMYVVIGALFLVLIVIGSAIGASLLLSNKGGGTPSSVVGHAFFQDDAIGHAAQLRIDLQNVAPPPQGKRDVAWLKDSNNHFLLLGTLAPQNGAVSYTYPGDANHTNLISIVESVTVTQEDIGPDPVAPRGKTVYQASIDATAFPYIRNILYHMSGFPTANGVVVGLYDTIKSMNDKTGSISDSIQYTHDYALALRQATRVIEMIDGHDYARSSGDLPAKYVSFIDAKVGIVSSPSQQGYLDTLQDQLQKIRQSAANNATLLQHVTYAQNAITDLKNWIQQIRTDDVAILKASELKDSAIINTALQLKQLTSDAYTGHVIPPAESPQNIVGSAGALQAYLECLYMATLDLKAV